MAKFEHQSISLKRDFIELLLIIIILAFMIKASMKLRNTQNEKLSKTRRNKNGEF